MTERTPSSPSSLRSHPKQVTHLQKKSVIGAAEAGAQRILGVDGIAQRAAVAGKDHRPGVRLVREQQVAPEGAAIERRRPDEAAYPGIEDEQRRLGARV